MHSTSVLYALRQLPPRGWRSTSHFICRRCMSTNPKPALFKMLEDGSEQPINEDELFEYSRHRWLRNYRKELDMRYVKFDIEALINRALRGNQRKDEGKICTGIKITKLLEGDNNKVLLLTMNDGSQMIARLPNPIAGPSYYMVGSEVATRKFIGSAMDCIPIPRLHDWDFRHNNIVGAEWIIEDKAHGEPLRKFWFEMDRKTQFSIVRQIVKIEKILASIKFPCHGSLYLRRWLMGDQTRYAAMRKMEIAKQLPSLKSMAENGNKPNFTWSYAIGPSVDRLLYQGLRVMKQYYGPFFSLSHYGYALGRNERRFIKNLGWNRPNFFQSRGKLEDPGDINTLVIRFLNLSQYIAEDATSDPSTISHPNLSLDNIFIDPETKKITCLTGWQGTVVSPPILKRPYPPFLDPQFETPSEKGTMRPRELYVELIKEADPLRYQRIFSDPEDYALRIAPLSLIRCVYEAENAFALREALLAFADYYDRSKNKNILPMDLRPGVIELRRHALEKVARSELEMTFHMIQDGQKVPENKIPDIPMDGRVRTEHLSQARYWGKKYRKHYMDIAGNDEDRTALHKKLWPLNNLDDEEDFGLVRQDLTVRPPRADRNESARMVNMIEKLRKPDDGSEI